MKTILIVPEMVDVRDMDVLITLTWRKVIPMAGEMAMAMADQMEEV